MSTVLAPFGLLPIANIAGVLPKPTCFPGGLASGYATNLYEGTAVKLVTAGTIDIAAGAEDLLGAFAWVEYQTSINGPVIKTNRWVANTVATNIKVFVYADPTTIYEIQSTGSIAATAVGDGADFTNNTVGSAVTGTSGATLSPTLVGAGNPAQFRIMGFSQRLGNVAADTYTVVVGYIGRSQLTANKNVL